MSTNVSSNRNSEVKRLIDERIAYLMDTPFWETKIQMLSERYQEDHPSLTSQQAYEFIIDGVILQFKDPTLDYLWHRYINNLDAGKNNQKAPLREKVA